MSIFILLPPFDGSGGGGVVPPPSTIVDYVEVADQAARLALINPDDLQVGDLVRQLNDNTYWRLIDTDPSQTASWAQHFLVTDLSGYVRYVTVADQAARLALTNPADVKQGDLVKQLSDSTFWRLSGANPAIVGNWAQHFYVQTSDDVPNNSNVTGVTLTDALNNLDGSVVHKYVVADQASRLALLSPSQVSIDDVVRQIDTDTLWRLIGSDPSDPANWKEHFKNDALTIITGYTLDVTTEIVDSVEVGVITLSNGVKDFKVEMGEETTLLPTDFTFSFLVVDGW